MTKSIGAALKTHIAQNLTTVATCWRLQRQDGQIFGFTDHDVDIDYGGVTYESASGYVPSALDQNRGLAVDNMEVVALIESDKVAEDEVAAGLFDNAILDVFILNYENLGQGVMYLLKGWVLGEVEIRDNAFQAEIRGKTQRLLQQILELVAPGCGADLGDLRCGVDLDDSAGIYWRETTVTSVTDRRTFVATGLTETEDVFMHGKVTFESDSTGGENAGLSMEVKKFDPATDTVTLFQKMPYDIGAGDAFRITYGCDKSAATCKNRFSNLINFRGFNFVPGFDKILEYK